MPNRKTHPLTRRHLRRPRRKRSRKRPVLKFSPYAWAKLLFLRDLGPTEVGGFGIAHSDNVLSITDIALVTQRCTEVTVEFDDESVADLFDEHVDLGLRPEQFARIWIHTHPDVSARPSTVDVETFDRVFSSCDWAIMFILAKGGETFAQLHWRQGGPAQLPLSVEVDYSCSFAGTDHAAWEAEYRSRVTDETEFHMFHESGPWTWEELNGHPSLPGWEECP